MARATVMAATPIEIARGDHREMRGVPARVARPARELARECGLVVELWQSGEQRLLHFASALIARAGIDGECRLDRLNKSLRKVGSEIAKPEAPASAMSRADLAD